VARATAIARKRALESGISPLDYMLKVMRNSRADGKRRDDMAKAAAPYVHSRLNSVTHSGSIGTYDLTKVSDADLDRLESILGPLALAGGDQSGEGETAG